MLSYSDFVYGCHADAWFCCHMLLLNCLRHTCVLVSYCCDAACLVELFCWLVLMLIATLTLNLVLDCCANGCLLFNAVFAENLCRRVVIILCWHLLIIECWADSCSGCYAYSCLFFCCDASSLFSFAFWCLLNFLTWACLLFCCQYLLIGFFACYFYSV